MIPPKISKGHRIFSNGGALACRMTQGVLPDGITYDPIVLFVMSYANLNKNEMLVVRQNYSTN